MKTVDLMEASGQPRDNTARLRRALAAVGPAQHKPWVEMACAIVLALATTASAWRA